MTFLHLAMLSGAALVVVPIALHLIMRQQPRLLEFPALRFVQRREQSNRRKMRLRHLLLLALRCGVIAFLAAALARPSIHASGILAGSEAPAAVAMVFDTSPRMDYRHHNRTRLELAREIALGLLTELPQESDVAVLDGQTSSAVFAIDPGAAKQRITRLSITPAGQALALLIEDGIRLLGESQKPRKELYVFTDLTQPSWSGEPVEKLSVRMSAAKDIGVYVVDVGVTQPHNSGLASVAFSSQTITAGAPLRLQTELAHLGTAATRTIELYLADKTGQMQKRSQETIRLGPGESQSAQFELGVLSPGVQQGYLKIAGEDTLAWDNERYFTVEVKPPWRVLVAAPNPVAENAFFLAESLAPRDLQLKGAAMFDCRTVALRDLAKQPLNTFSVVCLVDPGPLDDTTWGKLNEFVESGGGVAIFLGRNARLDALNKTAAQALLPARLLRHWKATSSEMIYLAPQSLQHPIFAKLRSRESAIPWDGMPVFTHWQLAQPDKGTNVVMPYTNGLPALLEKPIGKGRVMTLTTSVSDPPARSDAWNVLLTGEESWPFFVVVNEMMLYLAGGSDGQLNYQAGETAVLSLDRDERTPIFSLLTPRGDRIRQSADLKRNALVVTSTEMPGNYKAIATVAATPISVGFSVNLPAEVSRLERIGEGRLTEIFGRGRFKLARSREEIDRNVSVGRVGWELYPYLMVVLALLLAAEQILSNRFYRHEQASAPSAVNRELLAMRKQPAPPEELTAAVRP